MVDERPEDANEVIDLLATALATAIQRLVLGDQ